MTIADIQKIAAKAVADALRLAPVAEAPAPVQAKPARDAVMEKRLAALAKAREAKKAKAKAAPATKPAAAKAAKPAKVEAGVTVIGGIELLDYTREDGTPGVVIRPKGRRRGIGLAKGDWSLFVGLAQTFRTGETMNALGAAVKARIGG